MHYMQLKKRKKEKKEEMLEWNSFGRKNGIPAKETVDAV